MNCDPGSLLRPDGACCNIYFPPAESAFFKYSFSTAKPKYAFDPVVTDPWDGGTYIEDVYKSAADAIGSQARLFAYDHGATIV